VQHIEKWLAAVPELLGEELLVVTTQFAGFDKTKERSDILALDRAARLVVIELKRDVSGTCSRHNPGKSQGRPNEKHGLKGRRAFRPTRLRSPTQAPVPDRSTLRPNRTEPPWNISCRETHNSRLAAV
jgi:hypothetical protein